MNSANTTDLAATDPVTNAGAEVPTPAGASCSNCGAELLGAYCYACGQPVKGMIRPLSSMLSDVADTIFNIDSRIFRTLFPLYFRPGYLSNEYFSGRRVRYVTPFRLYFFLSVAAFLLIQLSLDSLNPPNLVVIEPGTGSTISHAKTAEEVIAQRDAAIAGLKTARQMPFVPGAAMDKATREIQHAAERRLAELKAAKHEAPQSTAADTSESTTDKSEHDVWIGNTVWDPRTHPIRIGWLPDFANERLSSAAIRLHDNLPRIKQNPRPFFVGTLGILPGVLFVLMPLFAMMLKIFYIFKRRLYMEHLIVALHSHSFIFLSLIFLTLAGLIKLWANTAAPWFASVIGWSIFLMGWWLPIHLLLMQKKVYKQGWFLTVLKYCIIGIGYFILILLGLIVAFAISLATV